VAVGDGLHLGGEGRHLDALVDVRQGATKAHSSFEASLG
jgi:hypothetical protein